MVASSASCDRICEMQLAGLTRFICYAARRQSTVYLCGCKPGTLPDSRHVCLCTG